MEKLPLNYFKNQFDSTASRAQSGAVNDGFWRVIAGATPKYRQVLSYSQKISRKCRKNRRQAMEREVNFQIKHYEIYEKRPKNNAHYAGRLRLAFPLESLLEID